MSIEELRRRYGGGAAEGDEEDEEEEEEEDEAFVFDQEDAVDDETTMAEAEVGETSQDVQDEIKVEGGGRNVYRGVAKT